MNRPPEGAGKAPEMLRPLAGGIVAGPGRPAQTRSYMPPGEAGVPFGHPGLRRDSNRPSGLLCGT